MKFSKKEKEKLAERFNISIATYYNWEKSKPDLIQIIELGLQKEKEIKEELENEIDFASKLEELTKRMDIIERVK
jgi:hypothetical protein